MRPANQTLVLAPLPARELFKLHLIRIAIASGCVWEFSELSIQQFEQSTLVIGLGKGHDQFTTVQILSSAPQHFRWETIMETGLCVQCDTRSQVFPVTPSDGTTTEVLRLHVAMQEIYQLMNTTDVREFSRILGGTWKDDDTWIRPVHHLADADFVEYLRSGSSELKQRRRTWDWRSKREG